MFIRTITECITNRKAFPVKKAKPTGSRLLRVESLETRQLLTATFGDSFSPPMEAPIADLYEPNNSKVEVDSKLAGGVNSPNFGTVSGTLAIANLSIHHTTDVDWFRFAIQEMGNASHYVEIQFPHLLGDIDMELYNSNGILLDSSLGAGDIENITLSARAAGVYYVRVFGLVSGGVTNTYSLTLQTPLAIPLTDITPSTNSPHEGTKITTTISPPGANATYQWYRGNSFDNVTTLIVGALNAEYTPTSADVGLYIKVVAQGTGASSSLVSYTLANRVTGAPSSVTVTTTNDGGPGSLRQAIADIAPNGTITFASSIANKTITLTSGALVLTKSMTISGANFYSQATQTPGITISGNNRSVVLLIEQDAAVVSLIGLAIVEGKSDLFGGGISSNATLLTITHCAISKNNSSIYGGGIYNDHGMVIINNSTITGNSASDGGGICNFGELFIANSMIAGNFASSNGGGIWNYNGLLTVRSSTLAGNIASLGGGLYNYSDKNTVLSNTIVAKNSTDIYHGSGSMTGMNNLIGNGANSSFINNVNGNLVGTSGSPIDPMFVALPTTINATNTGSNYNPSVWNLRLRNVSPAIDKGNNASATYRDGSTILFDLAGNARIYFSTIDMGAFENAKLSVGLSKSTYSVQAGCWVQLEATNIVGSNLTYWWDFSGTGIGTFIQVSENFWACPDSYGLLAGTHTIRLIVKDSFGNQSELVTAQWIVSPVSPIFSIVQKESLGGQVLALQVEGFFPGRNLPLEWIVKWGDSSSQNETRIQNRTSNINVPHYYASQANAATYAIMLTLVYAGGGSETFFVGTHTVPGNAPAPAAIPAPAILPEYPSLANDFTDAGGTPAFPVGFENHPKRNTLLSETINAPAVDALFTEGRLSFGKSASDWLIPHLPSKNKSLHHRIWLEGEFAHFDALR